METRFLSSHPILGVYIILLGITNLKATPACQVTMQGKSGGYVATIIEGEAREKYWTMAVNLYRGYSLYSQWAAPRRIPVILLRPVS